MLMNSKYDGYVFGQATAPQTRTRLRTAAHRGNRAAMHVMAAQSALGAFGDDPTSPSKLTETDDTSFDPNGWPPSSDVQPTPPPPPPPAGGTGFTLNDLKGVGSSVTTGIGDAAAAYNQVKGAVAPIVKDVSSAAAQNASMPAGNAGASNPSQLAAAVQAFRTATAAFITRPSAPTFNNAIAAWHTALDTYSSDAGNPPAATATVIARIIAALNVAASQYDDMYAYWAAQNANRTGNALTYVASAPAAARMASMTFRAGAPTAAQVASITADAGLPTADGQSRRGSSSGIGGGAMAIGGLVLAYLALR